MEKAKQPIRYVLSSVSSFLVDVGLFYVLKLLLGSLLGVYAEPVCNVTARAASSFFNFNLNNRLVFGNTGSYGKALFRYYCLAVPQAAASTVLWTLFALGILLLLEASRIFTHQHSHQAAPPEEYHLPLDIVDIL